MEWQEIDRERKEDRVRPKKRELHELPYTEMVKSGIGIFERFMGEKNVAFLNTQKGG